MGVSAPLDPVETRIGSSMGEFSERHLTLGFSRGAGGYLGQNGHSYADHCARIGEALRRSIERCWFQAIWREELVRPTFSAHCGGGPEEKTLGSKGAGIREFQKSSSHLCSSRERTGWKGGAGLCSATMGGSRVFGLAAGGPKVVRWRCGARKLLKTGQW